MTQWPKAPACVRAIDSWRGRRDRHGMAPLHARLILLWPDLVQARLAAIAASGHVPKTPNLWQIELGVMRMWHRVVFRPNSIGVAATNPVQPGWRARLLAPRPLRFPFVLAAGSVRPWDLSGLVSNPAQLRRHMLGTHHDGLQFVYDLQMLVIHPGELEQLVAEARAVVEGSHPQAQWLRSLCVYQGYHEQLLAVCEQALTEHQRGERHFGLNDRDKQDPDLCFYAYLDWCAAQPATPRATWQAIVADQFSFGRRGFGVMAA